MNALRLVEGVPAAYYKQRTGLDFSAITATWQKLAARGLVSQNADRLATTEKGLQFLNAVLEIISENKSSFRGDKKNER
jgi:oxygen-independent coproporphyrinogen-3 oxidase